MSKILRMFLQDVFSWKTQEGIGYIITFSMVHIGLFNSAFINTSINQATVETWFETFPLVTTFRPKTGDYQ